MVLTFAAEPFMATLPEIQGIMGEHWSEIRGAGALPLDLDLVVYEALDQAGCISLTTARDEAGELQGYIVMLVHRPLHYRQVLFAMDDAHFIRKAHRRGAAFLRMLRFTEDLMWERGVHMIRFHTKARPDLDKSRVFEAAGYHRQEIMMAKVLGG